MGNLGLEQPLNLCERIKMSKVRLEYGAEGQHQRMQDKTILREAIAAHTEAFLANGGGG